MSIFFERFKLYLYKFFLIFQYFWSNMPKISKPSKESWPRGPGFGLPQRGFALLAVHWFIEIPNIKLQITNNFQWPKFENPNNVSPWKVLVIEYCNLRFIWDLVLIICDFRHKTPRQSHLSLTWTKGSGFSRQNKIS